jgi:hypothetical protein
MASFDQLLDQSLEDLVRTGDLEVSLRRYPGDADQLRPLLEIAQATQLYYAHVAPAPGGLAAGRRRFLGAAAQGRERGVAVAPGPGTATRRPRRWLPAASLLRLVTLVLVVLVGMAALGGGLVWAASGSLPGDALYPVKLMAEDVRLSLASGPAGKVDVALGLVEERVEEMQSLAQSGRQVPEKTLVHMERHLESSLARAAESDEEQMSGLLIQIASRAREEQGQLEASQASLSGEGRAPLGRAVIALGQGAEEAEAGLSDPKAFRRRYQGGEGAPKPTPVPDGREQRHREGNQGPGETGEPTPTPTPYAAHHGPQATETPPEMPQRTERSHTPEAAPGTTTTPRTKQQRHGGTALPTDTPNAPSTSPSPEATSQGPKATAVPTDTPHHLEATAAPQPATEGPHPTATPQGDPSTPKHPRETSGPKPPGGGHGGGH